MRIGYVLTNFSPLSESFLRREVLGMCERGHEVFVYTHYLHDDPLSPLPADPRLVVRQTRFLTDFEELVHRAQQDSIDHLHGSLMLQAHLGAWRAARRLAVPFTISAYSGYSVFTSQDPNLYRELSSDPLCGGIVSEDPFMKDWLIERLGANAAKIVLVANPIDVDLYRRDGERAEYQTVRILAIARFVEKKGLLHLVKAFSQLRSRRGDLELWLIGEGPEGDRLRQAAAGLPDIRFLGLRSEDECRRAYQQCDIFCLPCVRTSDGDADGVPTTVLEAMAYEMPVVASDLLSMSHYVRDGKEGLLAQPGDEDGIARCLETLVNSFALRQQLGSAGRVRVVELCELGRNLDLLSALFMRAREDRWRQCMESLFRYRMELPAERRTFHGDRSAAAAEYFEPKGRFLDIGCGGGQMRHSLSGQVAYFGCDPVPIPREDHGFPFVAAFGEGLPFADESFDCALIKSTLSYVLDIDTTLAEAARVLKPGGRLYLHECVNDQNPIHLNHYTDHDLKQRLSRCLSILDFRFDGSRETALIVAEKAAPPPLVGIAVTTFDRAPFLRQCLDSALNQTYARVAVAVVDDGSTDETHAILSEYGDRIRVKRHDVNRGIAAAKNAALRLIPEEAAYVAILDSDDFFDSQFVKRCVEHLEAHPEAGLVYVDDILVDTFGQVHCWRESVEPWNVDLWLRTGELRGDAWLARRELVMETSLHDERMAADVDFDLFYQLAEKTPFVHLGEPLLFVREHDGRSSRHETTLARCHAANLVKFGFSDEYAYLRARRHPEWIPAIEEGIRLGKQLYRERARNGSATVIRYTSADLAINGGTPVRAKFLPFGAPSLGQEEIDLVTATLRSGWIGTGPLTAQFEREFAAYTGAAHAVALNSCTAGLFLVLKALGIRPGDEVITTPLTFAATANVIEHVGARPVFADIDPETFTLDPASVAGCVTEQTRAILPVHFGGMPCDLERLDAVAMRHGIAIIEDAAHAAGARFAGRMIGCGRNPAVFSFYANKNLTTAEGGMVTTNDSNLAERLRVLRSHGMSSLAWDRFTGRSSEPPDLILPGYKFNMPDFAAALGLPQLRRQEQLLERRQRYASRYDEAFRELPLRTQRRPATGQSRHCLHLYVIELMEGKWRFSRDEVVKALSAENIGATVHYPLVPGLRYYREKYGMPAGALPVAECVASRIITLPLTPAMGDFDVEDVIEAVHKVAACYAM